MASGPEPPRGPCASGRPARPGSEILLPPLLSLDGIQDRLPLGLVLLPDLFDLLLHHGVEGQEPLLKVLHCPTLKLEEKWKVQSRQGPGQRQQSREVSLCRRPGGGREKDVRSDQVWGGSGRKVTFVQMHGTKLFKDD